MITFTILEKNSRLYDLKFPIQTLGAKSASSGYWCIHALKLDALLDYIEFYN